MNRDEFLNQSVNGNGRPTSSGGAADQQGTVALTARKMAGPRPMEPGLRKCASGVARASSLPGAECWSTSTQTNMGMSTENTWRCCWTTFCALTRDGLRDDVSLDLTGVRSMIPLFVKSVDALCAFLAAQQREVFLYNVGGHDCQIVRVSELKRLAQLPSDTADGVDIAWGRCVVGFA